MQSTGLGGQLLKLEATIVNECAIGWEDDEAYPPAPSCGLDASVSDYLKLGFGGAHTESNQRLMYTSA